MSFGDFGRDSGRSNKRRRRGSERSSSVPPPEVPGRRFVPSTDPASELCTITHHQIAAIAALRAEWLSGLLECVARAHAHLQLLTIRAHHPDALVAIALGYQAQLPRTASDVSPPGYPGDASQSQNCPAPPPAPATAFMQGMAPTNWPTAPNAAGIVPKMLQPGPAPAFSTQMPLPPPQAQAQWRAVDHSPTIQARE